MEVQSITHPEGQEQPIGGFDQATIEIPEAEPQVEAAPAAEEIEVEIVKGEAPEPVENRPKKVPGDPQSRINQLVWEKNQEARRAAELERKYQAAFQHAEYMASKLKSLSQDQHATAKFAFGAAGEKTKAELEAATQEWKAAEENGDIAKKLAAQQRIARAQAEAIEIEKIQLPETPQDPVELQRYIAEREALSQPVQIPQPAPAAPTEAFLTWAQQNPWFAGAYNENADPLTKQKWALAIKQGDIIAEATGKGLDDPEYFAILDSTLKAARPDLFGAPSQPQQQRPVAAAPPPRQQPVVAPVGAPRAPQGTRRIQATKEEQDMAAIFGMDLKDYLSHKNGPLV